jgi:GTP-binding protein Era
MTTKSGFVSIIGMPNSGKSTLLNTLIGQEISIVTPKPQTTRNKIIGIYTRDNVQVVFHDTPGILKPSYKLQEFMKREIESTFIDSDIILLVIDASKYETSILNEILNEFRNNLQKTVTFCVLNKIDLLQKPEILHIINDVSQKFGFKEIFPVSAKKSFNTSELLISIIKYLPESEFYFDNDIVASQPEKFFVSEIIRAEVMKLCKDEIPFSINVDVDEFKERKTGKDYIRANLVVEKDSHKKIVIGKNGSMLKRIGFHSRKKTEEFLGKEIFLEIFVKVKKNWRNDDYFLKNHFNKQSMTS